MNLTNVVKIQAGFLHVCAVVVSEQRQRDVYCWGWNAYGQVGVRYKSDWEPIPQQVHLFDCNSFLFFEECAIRELGILNGGVCIITQVGTLWCWGGNFNSEIDWTRHRYRVLAPYELGVDVGTFSVKSSEVTVASTSTCEVSPIDLRGLAAISTRIDMRHTCVNVLPPFPFEESLEIVPSPNGLTQDQCRSDSWVWHDSVDACFFRESIDWFAYSESRIDPSNFTVEELAELVLPSVTLRVLSHDHAIGGGSTFVGWLNSSPETMAAHISLMDVPFDGFLQVFISGVECLSPQLHRWTEVHCAAPQNVGTHNVSVFLNEFHYYSEEGVQYATPEIYDWNACSWGGG